jgi:hypothetical protein
MERLGSIKASYVVYPVLIILVFAVFAFEWDYFMGTKQGQLATDNKPETVWIYEIGSDQLTPITGYAAENSESGYEVQDDHAFTSLTVALQWEDENPEVLLTNQPDSFKLAIVSPFGERVESQPATDTVGSQGKLNLTLNKPGTTSETGTWVAYVITGNCGDQEGFIRTVEDGGNSFTLSISFTWIEAVTEAESDTNLVGPQWTISSLSGNIHSLSGLVNILMGIFLVITCVRGRTLGKVASGTVLPVFLAAQIFLFNGLALFTRGAYVYSIEPLYNYWRNLADRYLYQLITPLLLLFALYYPRELHPRLTRGGIKKVGLGICYASMAFMI